MVEEKLLSSDQHFFFFFEKSSIWFLQKILNHSDQIFLCSKLHHVLVSKIQLQSVFLLAFKSNVESFTWFSHSYSCPFLFFFHNSIPLILEQHGAWNGWNTFGQIWRRTMVKAVLWLRWWQYLDADLYRAIFWLRKRNVFLQVSTFSSHSRLLSFATHRVPLWHQIIWQLFHFARAL